MSRTELYRVTVTTLTGTELVKEIYSARSDADKAFGEYSGEDTVIGGMREDAVISLDTLAADTWVTEERRLVRQ